MVDVDNPKAFNTGKSLLPANAYQRNSIAGDVRFSRVSHKNLLAVGQQKAVRLTRFTVDNLFDLFRCHNISEIITFVADP
jgi:hypothetical protein